VLEGYYPHNVALSNLPGGNQAAEAVGHLGWRWRWRTPGGYEMGFTTWETCRSAAEALAKSIPWAAARQIQAELFRDLFGNPFRPSPPLPSAVMAWNDRVAQRIAEGIYKDHAFERLPVLADALEDARCTDPNILEHCRGSGPHARGCWVIDLLLSKQ
jgi:hypothetical protein